jgi:CheY-like chemotaxis protein
MPGDASLTKRHAGVGIGLALSKRLVELMGGQIDFDSSKGSGSRFWFSLPDASVRSRPEFGRSAPLVPEKHSQHLSILIAEDNAVNLKVLLAMLPKDCFEVHIAQDGRQAVDLFLRKSFDLILMDCQMPHLSGLDATTAIRRLEQKVGLRRTPIIAVTAMSMDGDREKCFSVGMDDHLSKPVHRKVLLASLQRWLPASACGS